MWRIKNKEIVVISHYSDLFDQKLPTRWKSWSNFSSSSQWPQPSLLDPLHLYPVELVFTWATTRKKGLSNGEPGETDQNWLVVPFLFFLFLNHLFIDFFSRVYRFNTIKGYGFIVPDDGSPDVFVHQTEIQTDGFRSLADGEAVEFIPKTDDNGRMKATKVTGPDGANVQGAPFRPESDFQRY